MNMEKFLEGIPFNVLEVLMTQTEESTVTPMPDVKPGQTWNWDGFLDGEGRNVVVVGPAEEPGQWNCREEDGEPAQLCFMESTRPFWVLVEEVV